MILVHVATLLAVVWVYWRDIWSLCLGLCCLPFGKKSSANADGILALKLLAATLGTVIMAFVLKPYFDVIMTLEVVVASLFVTGFLIWGAEYFRGSKIQTFSWGLAIFLGLVQGLAIVPGISRSGLTIAFLIWWGIGRQQAAKLSFLLSIPTILGALVFLLKERSDVEFFTISFNEFIGCVMAFVVALVSIYWMKRLVEKHWIWFAPYCLVLSLLLFIFYA